MHVGEGNRVEQQATTNGAILTSTMYVAGGLEEITTSGASTTLTKYMGASGLPTAERVGTNGPLSYLATDGQGTVSETLDGSGNVTSAQLYTPYGTARYATGSSPTSLGYTGQRADSATGLDYYNARYYDPVAGQFASADTVDDGLNRYGYVAGNPTTATDPSGHMLAIDGTGGGGTSTLLDCHITYTCKTPPPPPPPPAPKPAGSGGSGGGAAGGGGGSGGSGKPVSCRVDDNPASSKGVGCYDWRNWLTAMKIRQGNQVQQLRDGAFGWAMAGLAFLVAGLVFDLMADNDPIKILDVVLSFAEVAADGVSWAASSFPMHSDVLYQVLAGISAFLGVLNALNAIVHGVAAWLLWAIRGTVFAALLAAKGPIVVIQSLIFSTLGNLVQMVGEGVMATAMLKYADAAKQENMSVWDWCDGPGKGQCTKEPNGGMPTA